ncbi:MAG: hypothetical protein PHW60_07360 [Kiritimatiellae bacterium]|nr:hypothetical protein [Kiritimatiellia bacterium]
MDHFQPWVIEHIIDDGVAKHDTTFILYAGLGLIVVALIGIAGGPASQCRVIHSSSAARLSNNVDGARQ